MTVASAPHFRAEELSHDDGSGLVSLLFSERLVRSVSFDFFCQTERTATCISSAHKRFSVLSVNSQMFKKATLSTLSIIAITFFNVSGGPWGSEPMFQPGPFWGIAGILGVSLCWGLPQSLVTAELSAALPYNGGYSIWVSEAFGSFWGMMECYLSWVSGVIDNAIYPVLIFDSATHIFGQVSPLNGRMIKVAIALVLAVPNMLTTKGAAKLLEVLSVLSMLPFVVFIVVALPHFDVDQLSNGIPPAKDVDWTKWILVVFWNLSGWDCVSTIAGEVADPTFNMITALMFSLCFTSLQYIIILGTAAAQNGRAPYSEWTDGSLTHIVKSSCGEWVGAFLFVASIMGNSGMYIAELMEDSYQLQGMADNRRTAMPRTLGWKHPKFDTPWAAIGFSMIFILPCACFDFSQLLCVDNCFSSLAALLELMAYIRLVRTDHFVRPYKAPKWLMRICVPVALAVGILVFLNSLTKSVHTMVVNVLSVLLGIPISYFVAYPPSFRRGGVEEEFCATTL